MAAISGKSLAKDVRSFAKTAEIRFKTTSKETADFYAGPKGVARSLDEYDAVSWDDILKRSVEEYRNKVITGEIRKTTGGKISSTVITGALNTETGKIYFGISGLNHNPMRTPASSVMQNILKKMKKSLHNYSLINCGEFNAINNALIDNAYDPLEMSQYTIKSNHRYTEKGIPGLYFSSGEKIVKAELRNYKVFDFSNRTMYSYDVKLTNMLDVSNPSVRSQLGISLDSIVGESYDVTHAVGRYAYINGYNGIIAPSARADGGVNIILFNTKGVK